MHKIIYVNELGYQDGYHTFPRHRLPQAYIELDNWYSMSYESFSNYSPLPNDIFIFQSPTNNELVKLKLIYNVVDTNKTFITQESSIFDWFDWPAQEQEIYIDLISRATAFMYHSEYDKQVMNAFTSRFVKFPGCINLFTDQSKKYGDGEYILIPNPIKRFQRGMINHKLVSDSVKNTPIYAINYNAPKNYPLSFPDGYKLGNITLVNRVNHDGWLNLIYNSKFGVDIHREFSGGNCSLEFGSLGVPLIGNINLDIQRDIFPDLSFDFLDYINIKKTIHLLLNDKDFYNEVSQKALDNTKKLYNSKTIVEQFKNDFNKWIIEKEDI